MITPPRYSIAPVVAIRGAGPTTWVPTRSQDVDAWSITDGDAVGDKDAVVVVSSMVSAISVAFALEARDEAERVRDILRVALQQPEGETDTMLAQLMTERVGLASLGAKLAETSQKLGAAERAIRSLTR